MEFLLVNDLMGLCWFVQDGSRPARAVSTRIPKWSSTRRSNRSPSPRRACTLPLGIRAPASHCSPLRYVPYDPTSSSAPYSTHLISALLWKRRKRLNDKFALFLLGLTQISFNASPSSDSYLYWRAGITSFVKFDTPTYQSILSTEKFVLLIIMPHNLLLS